MPRHAHRLRWIRTLLPAALALLFFVPALAQRIDIDHLGYLPAERFDLGEGLPDLAVISATVTPQGQVWLGTMRGLVRHNGVRMVVEPGPDGVFNAAIQDLTSTPDGRVWVSVTGRGVYVRDTKGWQEAGASRGLPALHALRLRSFGERLFATAKGLVAEWDGKRWRSRALPRELATTEIFDLQLEPGLDADNEVLWLATFGRGLYRCVGGSECAPQAIDATGARFFEVSSLESWTEADGSRTLWVGSYGGGLARLKQGRWQRFSAANGDLPADYIHQLQALTLPGQPPRLWVATRNGLALRIGDHWVPMDDSAAQPGTRVKALATGRTARGAPLLWIGSDQGAARLPLEGPWRTVSQVGREGNGVWAVRFETARDGSERLWLGSDGQGLRRYAEGAWTRFGAADGLPDQSVRSLARFPDGSAEGELWAGLWGGEIVRFDGKRFHVIKTPWPKDEREAVTLLKPDGPGALWASLREGGLARYADGRWHWSPPGDPNRTARIYDLQRVGGTTWASTRDRGLVRIDGEQWRYFGSDQGLPDDSYFGLTLFPEANGRQVLWAGSQRSGLVRIDVTDPDRPRLLESPELPAPPDPYVYEVVRDGRGDLVICSNYGAARWQPMPDGGYRASNYHRSDGLPHDECNYGAMQVDDYGRVWIGTIGGAAVFAPGPAVPARAAPLQLEQLLVDERPLLRAEFERALELEPGLHNLQFEVALLNGEREAQSTYRSQLIGLEPAPTPWSDDNRRSFTALPAGDYRLRIEARDYAGIAATPIEIGLEIPPPLWRTTPFRLGLAALGLLVLLGSLRLRERRQRARERQLVELVRLRTGELEARGIELRRMNEELTRLSYHDPLTDLANRRMLLERLHGEWALGLARGTPVAFLLLDVDGFKQFNDVKGHLAGDDCLREIGRRIDGELRAPDDTAGRYGGEEFGVVLPGLDLHEAAQVAERVRRAVIMAGVAHPRSEHGLVTVSLGVASMLPLPGLSAELLIAAADAALYRAKSAGRNRVELASPDDRPTSRA